jgi:hypothetical protein
MNPTTNESLNRPFQFEQTLLHLRNLQTLRCRASQAKAERAPVDRPAVLAAHSHLPSPFGAAEIDAHERPVHLEANVQIMPQRHLL